MTEIMQILALPSCLYIVRDNVLEKRQDFLAVWHRRIGFDCLTQGVPVSSELKYAFTLSIAIFSILLVIAG